MNDAVHPLTETHLQAINDALDKIARGRQQLQLAQRAEVPGLEERAKQFDDAERQLRLLKTVYFPGR